MLPEDISEHGERDGTSGPIVCKYCGKELKGVSRFRGHISGQPGAHAAPCLKCPHEARLRLKQIMDSEAQAKSLINSMYRERSGEAQSVTTRERSGAASTRVSSGESQTGKASSVDKDCDFSAIPNEKQLEKMECERTQNSGVNVPSSPWSCSDNDAGPNALEKLPEDINEHGRRVGGSIVCNYCGKEFSRPGRFRYHIIGRPGHHAKPCLRSPHEVRTKLLENMENESQTKLLIKSMYRDQRSGVEQTENISYDGDEDGDGSEDLNVDNVDRSGCGTVSIDDSTSVDDIAPFIHSKYMSRKRRKHADIFYN